MKITIHKFIYDTDNGTGCDLFLSGKDAVAALVSCAESWGYEGPENEEAVEEWREKDPTNIDTYFTDSDEIEVPTPHEIASSIIAEIASRPDLMACRSFSELHDHCDANVLGDSEKTLELLPHEQAIAMLNEAQNFVNEYLSKEKFYIVVGRQHEGQNCCWTGFAENEEDAFESFCGKLCDDDEITREYLNSLGGPIIEYSGWSTAPIMHIHSDQ